MMTFQYVDLSWDDFDWEYNLEASYLVISEVGAIDTVQNKRGRTIEGRFQIHYLQTAQNSTFPPLESGTFKLRIH